MRHLFFNRSFLIVAAALGLTSMQPSPVAANCEAGGYMIHTIAEYARLDETRQWFFRYEFTAEGALQIESTSAHSDELGNRLETFLRGPYRSLVTLASTERRCAPDLAPPYAVITTALDDVDGRIALRIPSCLTARDTVATTGYLLYDRDAKVFRVPAELAVARRSAVPPGLGEELLSRIFALGLKAEQSAAATINPYDVDGVDLEIVEVGEGEPPFRMIFVILRLRNLDTLLAGSGYATEIGEQLAEFPVIFLQRPGEDPFYVADGSWCASYRLAAAIAQNVRELTPLERFALSAAYDLSGDGLPDVLVVNETVAYLLGDGGELTVIDWPQGC